MNTWKHATHQTLAILLLGIMVAGTAGASDLRYSFVEGSFSDIDAGNGIDGTAIGVSVWHRMTDKIFVIGGLQKADLDGGRDVLGLAAGAGYIYPVNETVDAIGILSIRNSDVDFPGGSRSDTGFGIQLGARVLLTPKFQLRGMVNYVDVFESDTSLLAQGEYYFGENFGVQGAIQFAGDSDAISVGVNYYFGN